MSTDATQATFDAIDDSTDHEPDHPERENYPAAGTPAGGFPRRLEAATDAREGFRVRIETLRGSVYEITEIDGYQLTLEQVEGSGSLRFAGRGPEYRRVDGRGEKELFVVGIGPNYEPDRRDRAGLLTDAPERVGCPRCDRETAADAGRCVECGGAL